jgi:ankyrin repeat protein
VNVRTARGETALHLAVTSRRKSSGNPHELVTALLEAGCDGNIQENLQGRTTLHALVRPLAVAVADPTSSICDLMLETFQQLAQKSDVNLKDHRQRTPLHRLAASGCTHLKAFQVRVLHQFHYTNTKIKLSLAPPPCKVGSPSLGVRM